MYFTCTMIINAVDWHYTVHKCLLFATAKLVCPLCVTNTYHAVLSMQLVFVALPRQCLLLYKRKYYDYFKNKHAHVSFMSHFAIS